MKAQDCEMLSSAVIKERKRAHRVTESKRSHSNSPVHSGQGNGFLLLFQALSQNNVKVSFDRSG